MPNQNNAPEKLPGTSERNQTTEESSPSSTGKTSADRQELAAFLKNYPTGEHISLASIAPDQPGIKVKTFDNPESSIDWAVNQNDVLGRNVYFSTAQLLRPIAKKASREDVAAVPALFVDIDARAGEQLDDELNRILKLLDDEAELKHRGLPGLPTLALHSGGGAWAFWFLPEPLRIDGDLAKAEAAAAYNLGIANVLGGDACQNVDRIARLPGTINYPDARKRAKGRKEAMAEALIWRKELRYRLDQFMPASPTKPTVNTKVKIESGKIDRLSGADDPRLVGVSDGCKAVIVHGCDQGNPDRFAKPGSTETDRSRAMHYVCCELVRSGCSDETIYAVITDTDFGISASVLDKGGNTHTYAVRQIEQARQAAKPRVQLPEGTHQHRDTASQLAGLMRSQNWFRRDRQLFTLTGQEQLDVVRSTRAVTEFERVAEFYIIKQGKNGVPKQVPTLLKEGIAKIIIESDEFIRAIPEIQSITDCAVLVERDDTLVPVVDYDEKTRILARGSQPEEMSWQAGRKVLLGLLRDYRFYSEADSARFVAALITPALNTSGMLGDGRIPMLVMEADDSQSGKGLAVRLLATIYGSKPRAIGQMNGGGVGSLRESIEDALVKGYAFINIDNIRGRISVPRLESALTEPSVECRIPHRSNVSVDPRGICFTMTSNNAELTPDLANRCNIVRIRKQPTNHQFHPWAEGGLIEHIRVNQPRYLGAIWAILREWYRLGKPLAEDDGNHDFRPWARATRHIVRNILEVGDPVDGVRTIQQRTSNSNFTWLREIAIAAVNNNRAQEDLRASDLLDIATEHGIAITGVAIDEASDDEASRKTAMCNIGRRLGSVFRGAEKIDVDGFSIERQTSETVNDHGKHDKTYRIVLPDSAEAEAEVPF